MTEPRPRGHLDRRAGAGGAVVVIGIGNRMRGDDAAGLLAVDRLRERALAAGIAVRVQEGEALGLLEQWEGADAALLVDAIDTGSAPGSIHRFDVSGTPLPAVLRSSSSTHAVGLDEAIELARALGRLPAHLVIFGVQGLSFASGGELSRELETGVAELAELVLGEALQAADRAAGPAAATAAWP